MLLNVSLPQLLFLPPLLLLVSGLALFNFQTLFRFLSTSTRLSARSVSLALGRASRSLTCACLRVSPTRRGLADLKDYMTIPAVRQLRPYVDNLRFALEQVLGKAAAFKFNVSHVLMMAVVIMLLAVYNALQKSVELQQQQVQLQLARQKSKRA